MFKKLLSLLLIPLALFSQQPGKPTVLVTIVPYVYFVNRIAGDTVRIQALVPPGINIHIYEPTPKDVEGGSRAQVWFRIDEPLEKRILKVFKERNPHLKVVNLQEGLPLVAEASLVEHGSCGHFHEGKDLHTWVSPKLALEQCKVIADTLIALFPQQAPLYQSNFEALSRELTELDRDIALTLSGVKGDAILISHPSLGYFCKDYGLVQLSVECEGKDPRPKDIEDLMNLAKVYKVRCVLLQKDFNNRGAQYFASRLKLHMYRIDPYAEDYVNNMRQIAGYIAR